jgi:hypothetical protein
MPPFKPNAVDSVNVPLVFVRYLIKLVAPPLIGVADQKYA